MDFSDLAPLEIPITNLLGKDYVLREASADAVRQYDNAVTSASKRDADGNVTQLEGFADRESLLVSMCLFQVVQTANGPTFPPVTIEQVLALPGRAFKKLFDWVHESSEMDQGTTPDALRRQIAKLQKRLDDTEKDTAKNAP